MNDLTPEQKKQIDSWASQRDAILLDIANKITERDRLSEINRDLASSSTEISNKIQQFIGRLEELEKKEAEQVLLIKSENSSLIALKSLLQTEVSALKSEISALTNTKKALNEDISIAAKVYESVFSRSSDLERIVSETVKINSSNAFEVKQILIEAGSELKKIIDIGAQNVAVTNRAIAEIPKMIVDIHRDVIERKKINKHKIK